MTARVAFEMAQGENLNAMDCFALTVACSRARDVVNKLYSDAEVRKLRVAKALEVAYQSLLDKRITYLDAEPARRSRGRSIIPTGRGPKEIVRRYR